MIRFILLGGLLMLVVRCGTDPEPKEKDLGDGFTSISFEESGASKSAINTAIENAESIERFTSLMVLKDGRILTENYFNTTPINLHDVRSVTKSVVSTLTLIAYEDGLIQDLSDPITDYLDPGYELTPLQEDIKVIDLLTMSAGFEWDEWTNTSYTDWITSLDQMQHLLDLPMASNPGEAFTYNSGAVHLLGVVLEGAIDMSLPEYAEVELFEPMDIEFVEWEIVSEGKANGGSGIDLRTRDLAKFGQMFLQGGVFDGHQILSSQLVNEATSPAHDFRWDGSSMVGRSYGYLWWTVEQPYDCFLAWGYGGQFIVVVPSQNVVVVTTTNWIRVSQETGGSGALTEQVLNIIFEQVLPAFN